MLSYNLLQDLRRTQSPYALIYSWFSDCIYRLDKVETCTTVPTHVGWVAVSAVACKALQRKRAY
jgi:hypothetical protein